MGKCLIIKGADFSAVSAEQVTIEDPRVVITVVASPAGGGTTTGTGSYSPGQSISISATPAEGYIFKQWNDGDTNDSRTITVGSSATTYTAEFEKAIEQLEYIQGAYLNASGVVSGEGQSPYEPYQIKFYKVSVNSVRITCTKTGVGGSAAPVWCLYSGVDEYNHGTGLIQTGTYTTGDAINDVINTSTYKYIGVCYRNDTSGYTEPALSENTTP